MRGRQLWKAKTYILTLEVNMTHIATYSIEVIVT